MKNLWINLALFVSFSGNLYAEETAPRERYLESAHSCKQYSEAKLHETLSKRKLLKVLCAELGVRGLSVLVFEYESDNEDLKDMGFLLIDKNNLIKASLFSKERLFNDAAPSTIKRIEVQQWQKNTFALITRHYTASRNFLVNTLEVQLVSFADDNLRIISKPSATDAHRAATNDDDYPTTEIYVKKIFILSDKNISYPTITVKKSRCVGILKSYEDIETGCKLTKSQWKTVGKFTAINGFYNFPEDDAEPIIFGVDPKLTLTSQSANYPTEVKFVGETRASNNPSKEWGKSNLYGSDNRHAALSKVVISKNKNNIWTVFIRNQFSFLCEVYFDEAGTPALLRNCESTTGSWSAAPSEIPLVCTARSKEIVCNGKYKLSFVVTSPAVMTIARKR